MAQLFSHEPVTITIPEAINDSNVTLYVISVKVGTVQWTVNRRYREFVDLHESLLDAGVDKDSLPEKKLLGHRDAKFIMKRRRELETYLVSIFHFLQHSLPRTLAVFLHLNQYDLYHILSDLASEQYEAIGQNVERLEAHMGPLQLHAISERFRSPRPLQDSQDPRYDFANVADFACSLPVLFVAGSDSNLGTSTIVPNSLRFDLLAFKNLTKLVLDEIDCCPEKVTSLGSIRNSLKHLEVHKSGLTSVGDILSCGCKNFPASNELDTALELQCQVTISKEWSKLEYLDLRQNEIEKIDTSIRSAPKLKTILFGGNKIKSIENLSGLPDLKILELSDNLVDDVTLEDIHTKLGQIHRLDLLNNRLTTLKGLEKLYSLTTLNAAGNRIRELDNVFPISKLPNLESLNLQGNPVTAVVDYRLKLFEAFGKRCSDLQLDNECPSQSEIDKVSILMALRVAKEGKSPTSLFGNLPRPV